MDRTALSPSVVPLAALTIFLSRVIAMSISRDVEPVASAAFNLAVTLAVVVLGFANPHWRSNVRQSYSPVMVCVGVYGAAAILGGLVGVVRHNEQHLLAGQSLSMGLLPLAALGGWMHGAAAGVRRFAGVVSTMSCLGCLAAFAFGFARIAHGQDPRRFSYPGGGAPTGTALAACLLGAALGATSHGRARRFWFAAAGVIAAYSLASSVRSLWVAGIVAAAAFVPLAWGTSKRPPRWALPATATILVLAVSGAAVATVWWARSRPNLLGRTDADHPGASSHAGTDTVTSRAAGAPEAEPDGLLRIATTAEVPGGGYRLRGEVLFLAPGRVQVEVARAGSRPTAEAVMTFAILGAGPGPSPFSKVVLTGEGATPLEVRLRDPQGAARGLRAVTLERLGPAWLGSLAAAVERGVRRPVDPDETTGGGAFAGDASLAFRFKESKAALTGFLGSSWPARLLGHGLGARVEFSAMGYDGGGRVARFENPNYLHNFYVFLLFKLGIVGLAAVGTVLVSWIVVPGVAALRLAPGDPSRIMLAAISAVWLGYAVWSLAAPEIVDFRVAPFWGFLLAAAPLPGARLAAGPGGARGEVERPAPLCAAATGGATGGGR
jgi:hypothetical protein